MNKEYVICPECSTENEEQYEFCKNCGTPLKAEKSEPQPQPQPQQQYNAYSPAPNYQSGKFILDVIDGNTAADVQTFVGKNAYNFLPKFSKMQISDSKFSWCWPAAVLGFLFGPIGAAFWFLYRKMYKIGAILIAVGFALGILNSVFFGTEIPFDDAFNSILQNAQTGNVDFSFMDAYEYGAIYSSIDSAISYVAALFGGLFGMHFYKVHVKKKIDAYKNNDVDARYYNLGLATIGGTSGGALALGIVAFVIYSNVSTFIPPIA